MRKPFNPTPTWIPLLFASLVWLSCNPKPKSQGINDDCPKTVGSWDSLKANSPQAFHSCLNQRFLPLMKPLPEATGNDWLAQHSEDGQPFSDYNWEQLQFQDSSKKVIYLKRIGEFDSASSKIIEAVGEYLSIFFQRPVKWMPDLELKDIPESARRDNPHKGQRQLHTLYLLRKVLVAEIPEDASMYLGFTTEDLYPSKRWNYVFGQASLTQRVGVWSIYRFGSPGANKEAFHRCLKRATKTASHEAGHIYGILHCTAWNCNMSGSNHLPELDQRPVYYCPEDYSKLSIRFNWNDQKRLLALQSFWKHQGLSEESSQYQKRQERLYP